MSKLGSYLKGSKFIRILTVVFCVTLTITIIKVDSLLFLLSGYFKSIVEMPRLFHCIMGGSGVLAILHLVWVPKGGIAKEHLLFKRLGPILSVPLTVVTHGIFFYCGLLIIYIFCYDDATVIKYSNLDRTTVGITMISLMTYAIYSMTLIIGDLFNPKEEKTGTIVEPGTEPTEENSEKKPDDVS